MTASVGWAAWHGQDSRREMGSCCTLPSCLVLVLVGSPQGYTNPVRQHQQHPPPPPPYLKLQLSWLTDFETQLRQLEVKLVPVANAHDALGTLQAQLVVEQVCVCVCAPEELCKALWSTSSLYFKDSSFVCSMNLPTCCPLCSFAPQCALTISLPAYPPSCRPWSKMTILWRLPKGTSAWQPFWHACLMRSAPTALNHAGTTPRQGMGPFPPSPLRRAMSLPGMGQSTASCCSVALFPCVSYRNSPHG